MSKLDINMKFVPYNDNCKMKLETATEGSAGLDLICNSDEIILYPGKSATINTGVSVEIPEGYAGFLMMRSGFSSKNLVLLANGVGLIDSDYRGEIIGELVNHSSEEVRISSGERVMQLVILPVALCKYHLVDKLSDTYRGNNGFGSTGEVH